jgi:hypothetical protein
VTRALARATSAARSPARRAAASVSSGVDWNPHDDPISARTPIPAVSDCVSPSTTRFLALIDS